MDYPFPINEGPTINSQARMGEIQSLTRFQAEKIPEKVIVVPVEIPVTPCSTVEIRALREIGKELAEQKKNSTEPVYVGIFCNSETEQKSQKKQKVIRVHRTGKISIDTNIN